MPKGLVFGALALLAVFVLAFTWLNNRSLEADEPVAEAANEIAPVSNEVAPPPAPAVAQPVVLTAADAVWIEVKDGNTLLRQGELAAGQSYAVPADAVAPVLTTGKPEALRITVGSQQAPSVGQPGRTVSGVSLKADDLMRAGAAAPAAVQPTAAVTTQPAANAARPRTRTSSSPAEGSDQGASGETNTASPGTAGETITQS
jgi:hypothetical protein